MPLAPGLALAILIQASLGPVPIATILADPERYNLHQVTIQGTAVSVQSRGRFLPSCSVPQRFVLQDDSGELTVDIKQKCSNRGPKIFPPVTEGERLVIRVQIYVSRERSSPPEEVNPTVSAIVQWLGRAQ